MEVASTLAHYNMSTCTAVKRFIGLVPDYKYFLSEIAVRANEWDRTEQDESKDKGDKIVFEKSR